MTPMINVFPPNDSFSIRYGFLLLFVSVFPQSLFSLVVRDLLPLPLFP